MRRYSRKQAPALGYSTAIVTITLFLAPLAAQATSNTFTETGITKLCGLSAALAETADVANTKLSKLNRQVQAAAVAQTKLFLTALTAETTAKASLFMVAAVEAGKCLSSAATALTAATPAAVKATITTSGAAGSINEAVALIQAASKAHTTKYCIKNTGGRSSKHNAPSELGCPNLVQPELNGKAEPNPEHITASGFKTFTGTPSLVEGGSNNCELLTSAADNSGRPWKTDEKFKIAANLVTIVPKTDTSATADPAAVDNIGRDWKTADAGNDPAKLLYNAATSVTRLDSSSCAESADALIKDLLNPNKLKASLKPILKAQKKLNSAEDDTEITALINKVAGDTANQATKLEEQVNTAPASKLNDEQTETTTIMQLKQNTELGTALIIAISELKAATTKKLTCPATEREDSKKSIEGKNKDCSEKKGDNCKDGCKWDSEGENKKCVKDPDYKPKQAEGGEKKLTKCSDAATEEECKKVEGKKPEGKNAVCGWIDNTCKDSSILVNRKLL
uniref:Variant surface glycoprotein 1125.208 n=1 Tax=Trypanosoma brucei TaxID=5691 RepID=A0A1J0R5F0_9TRYP|nr:variant surface glycoprotein 1125.208 [Trypanosoma brucei]